MRGFVGVGPVAGRSSRRWIAALAVAGAVHLSACSDNAGSPAAMEPIVQDSAGVRILEFPAEVLELEAAFRLSDEPEVRLGVMEGDEALHGVRDRLLESALESATSEEQRQSARTNHRDREWPELLPSIIDLFTDA